VIYGVLILDKEKGTPLVKRFYEKLSFDLDLLPSFVSALWVFSDKGLSTTTNQREDTMANNIKINEERAAGYRWVYLADRKLLFVFITDLKEKSSWLRNKLIFLREEFYNYFPELKNNPDRVLRLKGNILDFWEPFNSVLDEHIKAWSTVELVTRDAKIFDILEVYQQILPPLYALLDEKGRNMFMTKYEKLVEKYKIIINIRDNYFNLLGINVSNVSQSQVKKFLAALLEELMDIAKAELPEDQLIEYIRKEIFPAIRREINRISSYRLTKDIIPKILI